MQELVVSEAQLNQFIGQYLWPLIRISVFYFAIPVIGARTVPSRIRIALALFTTLLVVPLLPNAPTVSFMSLEGMLMIVKEVVIGLALGFSMQIVLHIFILVGQFVALKLGLGFAAQNDPSSGLSVTVISQFYLLLSTLLFLSVNGHLVVIQMIVDSFASFPVGGEGLLPQHYMHIVSMFSWMFATGLLLSLPLLTSLMIVNMSFGVMSRSAPQMNVFTVGMPITILFGYLLMWISLSNFLPVFNNIIEEGLTAVRVLVEVP